MSNETDKAAELEKTSEETRAKYGDNPWWESDDPLVIAWHQGHEEILLVHFPKFLRSLEKVTGMDIGIFQLADDDVYEALMAKVDKAWKKRLHRHSR